MKDIIKLALRNLKEHKSKTLIISLFILFGVAIVIMGNSFLESINRGLEKDFRANVTSDIVISPIPEKGTIIDIGGVISTGGSIDSLKVPGLADIEKIEKIIAETKSVKKQTKLITATVMLSIGAEVDLSVLTENDDLDYSKYPSAVLFAGEDGTYRDMFPDLKIIEGSYPTPGSNEIIVDNRILESIKAVYKKDLKVGDTVSIMGMLSGGKIREAKVSGIYKPANEHSAMYQPIYCEPSLARSFADLTYASSFKEELPSNVDLSLSSLSEDDLFANEDDDSIDGGSAVLGDSSVGFDNILGDTTLRNELNKTDDGSWQYILLRLDNARADKRLVVELNKRFKEEGLNAQAMNWKKGAYSYSSTVDGIGYIFNILIIILAIVVFIIIMNTMVVSVFERTSEIGTMRAIGAEKKFVRRLFNSEALILTSLSSVGGIIFAFIVMLIFNSLNLTITNAIAKEILGGGMLHFSPTPQIVILIIGVAIVGGLFANMYPVKSALKITPIKALSKE